MRAKAAAVWQAVRRLGPAGWVGLAASTVPPIGGFLVLGLTKPLAPWMREHAVAGPALALGMAVALGSTMLMPTYSFAILCGAAFGPAQGTITALIGIVLGGLINVLWARAVCGDRVINLIDERPKLAVLRRELLHASPQRTFLLMTLMRIPPGFPFALTNFMVAATRVHLGIVVDSLALGSIPRTVIVATAAGHMSSQSEEIGVWGWVIGIGSTLLLLIIVGKIAARALAKLTVGRPALEVAG